MNMGERQENTDLQRYAYFSNDSPVLNNFTSLKESNRTILSKLKSYSPTNLHLLYYATSFRPIAAPKTIPIKTSLFHSLDSPYKIIPKIAPPDAPIPVQMA